MYDPTYLWENILPSFLITIAIESTILVVALSRPHPIKRRLLAGIWLTACTYPIVFLVLPLLIESRGLFLTTAETFAPLAECVLFAIAFHPKRLSMRYRYQDWVAIIGANLASFLIGLQFDRWLGK